LIPAALIFVALGAILGALAAAVGLPAVLAVAAVLAIVGAVLRVRATLVAGFRIETPLLSPQHGREALAREVERSRRYDRPLVLLRIRSGVGDPDPERTVSVIRSCLRSTDHVWSDLGALFIVMPESDRTAGDRLLERIRHTATHPGSAVVVDHAAFPEDELSAAPLLDRVMTPRPSRPMAERESRPQLSPVPASLSVEGRLEPWR